MTERANQQERYIYEKDDDATARCFGMRTADKQAAFLLPHIEPGMSLLDCGCGPGTITAGLASRVAPGKVVAFDISEEQVRVAQKHVEETGVANVEFRVEDIFTIPFPDNTFDVAFVHNVLEHLNEPADALKEVQRVLKLGGLVGVRDADRGGDLFAPENGALARRRDIMVEVWKSPHMGGDPMMGRHLRSMLRQAGFTGIEATASFDVYGNSGTLRVLVEAGRRQNLSRAYVDQVIALGLADRDTLERINEDCMKLIDDPDAFVAIAHCEALGWKE